LWARLGAYQSGAYHTKLDSISTLLALLANIRLWWKLMAVTNTLVAYYITTIITAVKSFIVQAPGGASVIKLKGAPL
jgi:hypothetical protein